MPDATRLADSYHCKGFSYWWIPCVYLLCPLTSVSVALGVMNHNATFIAHADGVEATVIRFGSAEKPYVGRGPVFEYRLHGVTHQWRSSGHQKGPSDYRVGDTVTMFVDRKDPHRVLIDDFHHRWGLVCLLFGVAAITCYPLIRLPFMPR